MDCPDEDTFSLFLQGLSAPDQASAIESHIDVCRRCAQTSAEFGRLFGGSDARGDAGIGADVVAPAAVAAAAAAASHESRPPAHAGPSRPEARRLALLEALMAALNVTWAVVALPIASWAAMAIAGKSPAPVSSSVSLVFTWLGAAYVAAWGPLGALVALLGVLGIGRRRPWGSRVAYWHAVLSLPSVVLTPLAAFVLYRLANGSPDPVAPPGGGPFAPLGPSAGPPLADSWNRA